MKARIIDSHSLLVIACIVSAKLVSETLKWRVINTVLKDCIQRLGY